MMIYVNKLIASTKIGDTCPKCDVKALSLSVFQRYKTLLLIPLFPVKKIGFITCEKCKMSFIPEKEGNHFHAIFYKYKSTLKTPLWMYSGIFIAVFGIILITVLSNITSQKKVFNTSNFKPQINDYYFIKEQGFLKQTEATDGSFVYVCKVKNIDKNKIVFIKSFGVSDKLNNIQDPYFDTSLLLFSESVYSMSIDSLSLLEKTGLVMRFIRKTK
jgi:hypothetical protein